MSSQTAVRSHATTTDKPRLSFLQIWNMSFGFMGIQFGWGLQLANMSAIYAKLGAHPDKIPILWLAGPITGLLVQPVIGAMSDRTWNWLGRRRPYFLTGSLLASIALFFMPDAPALWAAAAMLWVLDSSINISMEPFRAFVADKLPISQRTTGFVMQSFFIGIGAAVANALPWIFGHFGVSGNAANGVPLAVQYSFKLGAIVFFLCVLYTIFTTKEYPPEDMEEFRSKKSEFFEFKSATAMGALGEIAPFLIGGAVIGSVFGAARSVFVEHEFNWVHTMIGGGIGTAIGMVLSAPNVASAIREMPATMKQLAAVQFFTWMALFCMWMFFGLATAKQLFNATDPNTPEFDQGTAFGGGTFAWYSIVCFIVAFLLPVIAKFTGRKIVHALALVAGGVSLFATGFIHDKILWQCTMIGVGIAWASILSMPYAILSTALPPARMGVYMGIFNFFIVIPEIVASISLQPVVEKIFHNDPVKVVMMGGCSMIIAALLMVLVKDAAQKQTAS